MPSTREQPRSGRRSPRREPRRLLLAAGCGLAALGTGTGTAVAASATTSPPAAYAYWGSFLLQGGSWTFAPVGPSARTVQDGTVEGWRFATVGTSGQPPRPPRAAPTFDQLCGQVPAVAGDVRVGVVVDYGRADDAPPAVADAAPPAPRGACARVPAGSSGETVLAAVAPLRTETGTLCAVDGYPARTCQPGVPLTAAATSPDGAVELRLTGLATPADGTLAAPGGGGATDDAAAAEDTSTQVLVVAVVALTAVLTAALALVLLRLGRRRAGGARRG